MQHVYVRVRICSVCVRLSQNALPHAAQTTAMQKKSTHAGERVQVRVCAHVQCLQVRVRAVL